MSQDVSIRQMLLKSSQPIQPPTEPFNSDAAESDILVESYADRLMDDLFDDVERMLDGGIKTTVEPISVPSSTAQEGNLINQQRLADLGLPLAALSSQDSLSQIEDHQVAETHLVKAAHSTHPSLVARIRQYSQSYDRLLLQVGCISIVVSLAVWFVNQQINHKPAAVSTPTQIALNPNPQAQGDDQFAAYMRHSIQAIDQKAPTGGAAVNNSPGSQLPTVTVPGNPKVGLASTNNSAASATRTPNGLQRIYVPVYQVPPGSNLSSKLSVAPLPVAPQAPAPTAVKPPIPLSIPGVARTLVGVMELGDRSAALIELNGVAQRYRVGESIGTSGWTLVEVSKNQAVVRRNGEVRSIFIGQNF